MLRHSRGLATGNETVDLDLFVKVLPPTLIGRGPIFFIAQTANVCGAHPMYAAALARSIRPSGSTTTRTCWMQPSARPRKRGPGRPPKPPGEARRDFYQARIRGALKKRLEEEAALQGRSLSEEIEVRLEQPVVNADLRTEYGPAGAVATAIIGRTLAELNRHVPFPQTWIDRPDMLEEAVWAAAAVFAAFGLSDGYLSRL